MRTSIIYVFWNEDDANFPLTDDTRFHDATATAANVFGAITVVIIALHKKMAPLKQARDMLDILIDEKNEGRSDKNSPWYKNCLGEDYITAKSTKILDQPFVNAVVKIQPMSTPL